MTNEEIQSYGWLRISVVFLVALSCHACVAKKQANSASHGDPTTTTSSASSSHKPTPTKYKTNIQTSRAISAGAFHTCALQADGALLCWGGNFNGQLGDGTDQKRSGAVWIKSLGKTVTSVSAGAFHTCAVKENGSLWCWGKNDAGQLGDGGKQNKLEPTEVTRLGTSVQQVSTGRDHTCAVKKDGSLWCWGRNDFGQIADGTTTYQSTPNQVKNLGTSVASVSAGSFHTCVVKKDGSLWCWGGNDSGQLGDGSTTTRMKPVQVQGVGSSITLVSAGNRHTCSLTKQGSLWCWGKNNSGELGDGSKQKRLNPVSVSRLGTDVTFVTLGYSHTCATKRDASLWCWGGDHSGQLGIGRKEAQEFPVQVASVGTTTVFVAAGGHHTCTIKNDASFWCWGENSYGQLGGGTQESNFPKPLKVIDKKTVYH
jgi:alpha-tubulin suppressor-like RCC1 family protein